MRSLTALSFLMTAVLVGCGETAPSVTGPSLAAGASRSAAEVALPFRTTSYTFHSTGNAPVQDCVTGEARRELVAEGTATHLGQYTLVLSFCGRNFKLVDGRGTFTAANGDLLNFVFEGTSHLVSPTSVQFTSFATFTGGTGRFTEATGEAVVMGDTGTGQGSWEGTISYKH